MRSLFVVIVHVVCIVFGAISCTDALVRRKTADENGIPKPIGNVNSTLHVEVWPTFATPWFCYASYPYELLCRHHNG